MSPKLTMVKSRLIAPRICPCSEIGRDRTFPESDNLKLVFWVVLNPGVYIKRADSGRAILWEAR